MLTAALLTTWDYKHHKTTQTLEQISRLSCPARKPAHAVTESQTLRQLQPGHILPLLDHYAHFSTTTVWRHSIALWLCAGSVAHSQAHSITATTGPQCLSLIGASLPSVFYRLHCHSIVDIARGERLTGVTEVVLDWQFTVL